MCAPDSATGCSARSPATTGSGGTRPAAADRATGSCSGGHRQAAAVSAVDTNRPNTDPPDPTAVPEAADSHGVRGVRFRNSLDIGRGVRLPGRLRQDCGDPQPPLWRDGSAAQVALARLQWSGGPGRRGRWTPAVRTRGHRRWPAGHWSRTPRHCGHPRPRQGMRTLRQRPRWTPASRTV